MSITVTIPEFMLFIFIAIPSAVVWWLLISYFIDMTLNLMRKPRTRRSLRHRKLRDKLQAKLVSVIPSR